MTRRKFGKHGWYHYDSRHRTKRDARKRANYLSTHVYKGQLWNSRITKDNEKGGYIVWVKRRS